MFPLQATAVVPETLEPSLQLAAAVLSQYNLPYDEVTSLLDGFRKKHLRELQALAAQSGTASERDTCTNAGVLPCR